MKVVTSLLAAIGAFLFVGVVSCDSSKQKAGTTPQEVVVNAPVSGVIRAVLVGDNASVEKNAAILEIGAPPQPESPRARPQRSRSQQETRTHKSDVALAEVEVQRAADKVQKIKPLVARGYASQADLDAARASYQDALARLGRAREEGSETVRETSNGSAPVSTHENTLAVLAPVHGRVRIISARVGERVSAGQALGVVTPSDSKM
jgi:multidrug resistance efflux pump